MLVVVAYDISNDRRRTRLHKRLKDFGAPVQYSVFECELEKAEINKLQHAVDEIVRQGDDVQYYFLCAACAARVARSETSPRRRKKAPPEEFVVVADEDEAGEQPSFYEAVGEYSLMAQVCDGRNLRAAWKKVKANRGCAGVDKETLADFAKKVGRNLARLQDELLSSTYMPAPVLRVSIPKPNGGRRTLGIPTVRDRVAQQAVYRVIGAIWEPVFSDASYAYRPGRSVGKALRAIERLRDRGFRWVVDADINDYFDNIDHGLLIRMVRKKVEEPHILRLISLWLKAQAFDGKVSIERLRGVPQGGVISPLLANIYLDYLDKELLDENYHLVRYADDFLILCNDKAKARQAVLKTEQILGELKLSLNRKKTRMTSFRDGFEFLGAYFIDNLRLPGKKARARSRLRWRLPGDRKRR